MTTRPRMASALRCGWGRSCTVEAGGWGPPPPDDHGTEAEGAKGVEPRPRLRADEPLGALRPSLRGDRGRRTAGRPRARGAVRLPARDVVARDRRGAGWRRAGLHHPVLFVAP